MALFIQKFKIMQINLHDTKFKNGILYLGWILFFACLFFRSCGASVPGTSVTIPAITKTLPADTIIKHRAIKIAKWYKDTIAEKKLLKQVREANQRLDAYQDEIDNIYSEFMWSDSIKKLEMYRLAKELKSFESQFEDENLKLTINGIIAGNQVKEITPHYTIKERKVEVAQKQVKFRILLGGGLGNSLRFDKPLFNANVGFQNAKGNIIRFSFDTQQRIMLGFDFSLFKFSK